jgi:hypothetical protein
MEAQLPELPMTESPAADPAVDGLVRARAGDAEGFRVLLRLQQARIFSIALRFTGRRAEAEELARMCSCSCTEPWRRSRAPRTSRTGCCAR